MLDYRTYPIYSKNVKLLRGLAEIAPIMLAASNSVCPFFHFPNRTGISMVRR
jgi:hypothetical protein